MSYSNHFLKCFVLWMIDGQSGDGKTKFGAKIANDMATVDWLKIDIRAHVPWSDISQWPKSL